MARMILRAYVKKGNTVFICTHILEIAEVAGRGQLLGEDFLSLC